METTIICWGYIGIMEKKMETTIICWGYIGIMENKMETTIMENQMEKKMENEMEYIGVFMKDSGSLLAKEVQNGAVVIQPQPSEIVLCRPFSTNRRLRASGE